MSALDERRSEACHMITLVEGARLVKSGSAPPSACAELTDELSYGMILSMLLCYVHTRERLVSTGVPESMFVCVVCRSDRYVRAQRARVVPSKVVCC